MQTISKGSHPGKSSVTFLPMIDMDPTNMSCIYSTLKFVFSQAVSVEMYHELNCPKITEQFSIIRASRDINFLQI